MFRNVDTVFSGAILALTVNSCGAKASQSWNGSVAATPARLMSIATRHDRALGYNVVVHVVRGSSTPTTTGSDCTWRLGNGTMGAPSIGPLQ